jgi:hypothetical protein
MNNSGKFSIGRYKPFFECWVVGKERWSGAIFTTVAALGVSTHTTADILGK